MSTVQSSLRSTRTVSRARRLARIDIAAGVLIAVAVLIAGPGLAIIGISAVAALGVCFISLLAQRRSTRKRRYG
jgi:hypothetical protein